MLKKAANSSGDALKFSFSTQGSVYIYALSCRLVIALWLDLRTLQV
jgi:hypothetical protein